MHKLRKLERAIAEGRWYEHAKATRVFADIAVGVGLAVTAGASIYGAVTQGGIANSQLDLARNQAGKQDQSFQQLQQLITNPGAFFDSPVYKAAADQGARAVAKTNAAQFGPNSGNEATALQTFGQGFAQQQLLSQEQLLAGMSGTGFNPTAAAQTASGAGQLAAGNLSSLGGLMSFFGNSGAGGGGGAGFTPMNAPSMGGTTAGWGIGADAVAPVLG